MEAEIHIMDDHCADGAGHQSAAAPQADSVVRAAHAKLNLSLRIGPLRDDGYHSLDSLMVPLALADRVSLTPADGLSLHLDGPTAAGVPDDNRNLAWRAAEALAELAGRSPDVAITLEKHIPPAGGLAGGSADAAAVLLGLDELWQLDLGTAGLNETAARLGSDVPFCLHGRAAHVGGRGEVVQPLAEPLPPLWAVLILAGLSVSTPDAYARLDENRSAGRDASARTFELAGLTLVNELEAAALDVCPPLKKLHRALDGLGVPRLLVAGSGATLFSLFDNRDQALWWEDRIRTRTDVSVIVTPISGGSA